MRKVEEDVPAAVLLSGCLTVGGFEGGETLKNLANTGEN
jgi:hypothetical protein